MARRKWLALVRDRCGVRLRPYLSAMENARVNVGPPRVGFPLRFGAWLLDLLFSTLVAMQFAVWGWGFAESLAQTPGMADMLEAYAGMEEAVAAFGVVGGIAGLFAASALMSVAYPLVEALTGASPGKWVMGLRVGTDDGQPGNVVVYGRRAVLKSIRAALMAVAGLTGLALLGMLAGPAGMVMDLGVLFMLAPHKQALHDKLARTAVYRRRDLAKVG